jgi:hypothetical protein
VVLFQFTNLSPKRLCKLLTHSIPSSVPVFPKLLKKG